MNQEHKLLHGSLCSFSLTKLRGYKANRTGRFGLRSNGALYSFEKNNNVKLYPTFRPRESFEIQKQNRNSENLTQLKRDIIRMSINTIRIPADALIVSVDAIRKSQNFLIVFFDEKGKIQSSFRRKMAFQYKIRHKTKSFSERNKKRS